MLSKWMVLFQMDRSGLCLNPLIIPWASSWQGQFQLQTQGEVLMTQKSKLTQHERLETLHLWKLEVADNQTARIDWKTIQRLTMYV